jgi:hypothetical protein
MKTMLIAAACCALLVQQADAQPIKKDHRRKAPPAAEPAPPAPPPTKMQLRGMQPATGAAGTTVSIRGRGLPDSATVIIGKQRVQATRSGRRDKSLTFVVPTTVQPGARRVSLEIDGALVQVGDFQVAAAADPVVAPPPPPPRPIAVGEPHPNTPPNTRVPSRRPQRKRWASYEIPVVSSYWPATGAGGTAVTIVGANFTPQLQVFIGNAQITGAAITPTSIAFKIPADAASGVITVRGAGNRRALAVGQFEVAKIDPMREWKKREQERLAAAQSAWKERRKNLAKDRAARAKALEEREAALAASREQRRAARLAEIRAQFQAAFLADENTQAALTLHAERLARLQRMVRLAEANDDGKLVVRIEVAMARENDRHTQRMAALEAAFQAQ